MTYTEIKEKGKKKYYYRGRSIRKGKKVGKQRIYLGVNLSKQELAKKEQEADKQMLNLPKKQEEPKQKQTQKPEKQEKEQQEQRTKNKTLDNGAKGLTVKKQENMPEWYEQVCLKGEAVDFGPVKGTMVIRPRGYYIWQTIQDYFNKNIVQATNTKNAYFPLFIPESFFKKEEKHAEGFSPEVAWVDEELTKGEERIAIRPTSETIMYNSYAQWIRSYKDLPFKINQWCNVVRWETEATKLFLRSREFLWQEGHCVYETEEQCVKDTINYIKLYEKLCEDLLALPVITGEKTEKERFAGAKATYTIEGFMPDGKALQCGTSHNLGQGFAKAFNINYLGKDKKEHIPWQNSWGISTRLLGAIIMTHSDDKGLVLPPKLAENKIVIIPILIGDTKKVLDEAEKLKQQLQEFNPILDNRTEHTPGYKFNEWELKGLPLRVEIGPKDIEKKQAVIVRRDNKEKNFVKTKDLLNEIEKTLDLMQKDMFKKAKKQLIGSIVIAENWEDFKKAIDNKKLVQTNFCGKPDCEDHIKDKTGGASSRCIPFDKKMKKGAKCVHCNSPAKHLIYFSKSY
jgi:prolyl-tRNA synthetase